MDFVCNEVPIVVFEFVVVVVAVVCVDTAKESSDGCVVSEGKEVDVDVDAAGEENLEEDSEPKTCVSV